MLYIFIGIAFSIVVIFLCSTLTHLEKNIMATFEELKAQMEANNVAIDAAGALAADANVKLDAVNVKIDELRVLVNNGNPVSQAQLEELAALGSAASVKLTAVSDNLAGIAADVADAEQS